MKQSIDSLAVVFAVAAFNLCPIFEAPINRILTNPTALDFNCIEQFVTGRAVHEWRAGSDRLLSYRHHFPLMIYGILTTTPVNGTVFSQRKSPGTSTNTAEEFLVLRLFLRPLRHREERFASGALPICFLTVSNLVRRRHLQQRHRHLASNLFLFRSCAGLKPSAVRP